MSEHGRERDLGIGGGVPQLAPAPRWHDDDANVDLGAVWEVNAAGVVLPSQLSGVLGCNVAAAEEGMGCGILRNGQKLVAGVQPQPGKGAVGRRELSKAWPACVHLHPRGRSALGGGA